MFDWVLKTSVLHKQQQQQQKRKLNSNKFNAFEVIYKTMNTDAHSEPTQISKIELFAKVVIGFHPLTIFPKRFILVP